MSFIFEFLKHPRKIGAIAPSGKALAHKMMKPIDFSTAKVIVEYGPGTGSFTKELIERRRGDTVLLLIEQNRNFYRRLKKEYGKIKNVHLIHGDAKDVNYHLARYGFTKADYIISGLPFTSLPKKVSDKILTATQSAIGRNGKFITFQYSLVKLGFFEEYFRMTRCLREMKNIPPAYVFVLKN